MSRLLVELAIYAIALAILLIFVFDQSNWLVEVVAFSVTIATIALGSTYLRMRRQVRIVLS